MSTFVGKIAADTEARYVRQIIRASGATERQFVRAALLAYCGMLMEKATEMREAANASGNPEGNMAEDARDPTDSPVQTDAGNTVVDQGAE